MGIAGQEPIYGNTSRLPLQLSLNCTFPEKRTESVKCITLLRFVPGRREVFDALWNDRNVIVKIFTHKFSAKRHLKREWKGLTTLAQSKINAPKPFFFGQTEKGDWVVVVEKIVNSITALEKYNIYQDPHKRLNLLKMICIELSSQHKVGILQKDFHLENFIYSNNKIFTLDPGQMQFYKNSVPKNKSISNLAMLLLILPSEEIEPKKELCKEYYQSRGWEFQYEDEQQLQKKIKLHRKKVIKQQLKKSLRTSKRFLQIEISHFSGIFSKSFCIETEAIDFINRIDILMTKGHILKNGNTSFVSHITWNNKDIVIKRYNHKNFFHSLRHTIINSRAKRNWLHAQKLTMLGIPTPKPLAFIEKRKGPILWNSYYITEYIKGPNLHVFLNDKSISENQHISTINQVEKIFNKMSDFLITHGDLKHTNILISEKGPILTDLDSMKSHKLNMFYKIRRKKDIKRFQKDGLNLYQ